MDLFHSKVQYKIATLYTAAEVVKHSFIVHNSISHLNLELPQSYVMRTYPWMTSHPEAFITTNTLINTQEKCRKIHGYRYFLYILNIDLPTQREWDLKSGFVPDNFQRNNVLCNLGSIQLNCDFYLAPLFRFVGDAIKSVADKLKILKWLINFKGIEDCKFLLIPPNIIDHFVDYMHPDLYDQEFVTECLKKMDFVKWMNSKKIKKVENVLYQIHLTKSYNKWLTDRFITYCFMDKRYVAYVLQLINIPYIDDPLNKILASKISIINLRWYGPEIEEGVRARLPQKSIEMYIATNKRRRILLLYLYWIYHRRSKDLALSTEALRLLWMALPDTFLSLEEMQGIYKLIKDSNFGEIPLMCEFYKKVVGANSSNLEPRSLQHHCRTVIRFNLRNAQQWIPEGIEKCKLPPKLKSYLKLEK